MNVYILSMERDYDREGHHYNCSVYTCLAEACVKGMVHENIRAGKYEMRIEFGTIDDKSCILKEIPREVAINYAVMKYPEKFDDKKRLKGETHE